MEKCDNLFGKPFVYATGFVGFYLTFISRFIFMYCEKNCFTIDEEARNYQDDELKRYFSNFNEEKEKDKENAQ